MILWDVGTTWKSICIHIKGDRVRRSEDSGVDGDLHDWSRAVELETISGATGAYSESHRLAQMGILEPSNAPYSNRWFTVPKKNGSLRFIQDLQPVNKVTIRNSGVGPIVHKFGKLLPVV